MFSYEICELFKNTFFIEHLRWLPLKIMNPTHVFSYEICELFKNTFFIEHLRWLPLKIMNSSSYLTVLPVVAEKIVSPIILQEINNDFAICKHCSGTLLLVENVTSSHSFENKNYIFQKGGRLFNRST